MPEGPIPIFLLLVILALFIIVAILLIRSRGRNEGLTLLMQQMDNLTRMVNDRLREVHQTLGQRLDTTVDVVTRVHRGLGQVEEANKKIYEIGKDIASLQEILRAPKLRGIIGELLLEDLLAQILPPAHYHLQHIFSSGEKVDAVIKVGDGLVPVDAKFPLDNFRRVVETKEENRQKTLKRQFLRDVKKHIEAISVKYIRPDEGTFDFALMYIPAENVYYETIIKDETLEEESSLFHYAIGRKVIPVSPNSFYAYLQVILLGLKGLRIEERAREIFGYLARLEGEVKRFRRDFERIGTHLANLRTSYERAEKGLTRLETGLERMASLEEETHLRGLNKNL